MQKLVETPFICETSQESPNLKDWLVFILEAWEGAKLCYSILTQEVSSSFAAIPEMRRMSQIVTSQSILLNLISVFRVS